MSASASSAAPASSMAPAAASAKTESKDAKGNASPAPAAAAAAAGSVLYVRTLALRDMTLGYQLAAPRGLAHDNINKIIYVADTGNHRICKVTAEGKMTVLAGKAGEFGYVDGPAEKARFQTPSGLAYANDGSLYVADTDNHRIRKIDIKSGDVTTVAGGGSSGSGAGGFADGDSKTARLKAPRDVFWLEANKTLYIADTANHRIRRFKDDKVDTIAGSGTKGALDGVGAAAAFASPTGVSVDAAGNIYVADRDNHAIRKIAGSDSTVSTFAGHLPAVVTGNGGNGQDNSNNTEKTEGYADGAAASAKFNGPEGVFVDHTNGDVWVSDTVNNALRKVVSASGTLTVSTVAGKPSADKKGAFLDGTLSEALLASPCGVNVSMHGEVYFCDAGNHRLRVIDGTPPPRDDTCRVCGNECVIQ